MRILKDEYGIEGFEIKVNELSELDKQFNIKTDNYLASNYNEEFYFLRNKGCFGLIVRKNQCSIVD